MAAPASVPRTRGRATLRRRVLAATLTVTVVAIAAFGVPLGIALSRIERDRVVLRLERQASRVLAVVPDEQLASGRPFPVPQTLDGDERAWRPMQVGVYDPTGRRLSGAGPAVSRLAAAATRSGHERSGSEVDQLAVAQPLRADRPGGATVRVAVAHSALAEELRESALLMGALAVAVLVVAGGVAFALARRLTRPLERLATNARQLGDGDFTVRTEGSRVREIDDVGRALDATAERLGALVERERAFTANASHQIRTPLTALRINLEAAPLTPGAELARVSRDAVAELDRLEATLDHLLAVARDVERPGGIVDLAALLDDVRDRWAPTFARAKRPLETEVDDTLPSVRASAAGMAHALDVLVENALVHGGGTVAVRARAAGPGVALDVHDEGQGVSGPPDEVFRRRGDAARGHGIGLALARSLVEADGGRLELAHAGPGPTFTVLLPAAPEEPEPVPAEPDEAFR